jgi:hypothetical protein
MQTWLARPSTHSRLASTVALVTLVTLVILACGSDDPPGAPGADAGPTPGADAAPPPVIDREHAGGNPAAVHVAGEHAYVAVGPRVAIWQLPGAASPGGTAPVLLAETAPLEATITGLTLAGHILYVADRQDLSGQLSAYDVTDPAAPAHLGTWPTAPGDTFSFPGSLAAYGNRLFVADKERGILVYDLSEPAAPVALAPLAVGAVDRVFVGGERLYYVAAGLDSLSLGALDLQAELAELGSAGFSGMTGAGVTATGLLVGVGLDGLQVHDVTDLARPVERYRDGSVFSRALAVASSAAYVPTDAGVIVLDLSDPAKVTAAPTVDSPTAGVNAADAAGGRLVIVTDRGRLVVHGLATPTAPAAPGAVNATICADCVAVAVHDGRLHAVDFAAGLSIANLRDLAAVGRLQFDQRVGVEAVAVAGAYAYLADWTFGLRVVDISDPAAPVEVAALQTGGFPSSVVVAGERAYLGESTNGGALRVIDISDPRAPTPLGAIATSKARDVEVRGELAFVADEGAGGEAGGLRMFDVSDPARIRLVAHYQGCDNALDVAVAGDLAALACANQGVHLLDIANPAAPVRRGDYQVPAPAVAWSVALDGARAVVGHDFGLTLLDLRDPRAPAAIDERIAAFAVRRVIVAGPGHTVAAAGLAGVYQVAW